MTDGPQLLDLLDHDGPLSITYENGNHLSFPPGWRHDTAGVLGQFGDWLYYVPYSAVRYLAGQPFVPVPGGNREGDDF